MITKISRAGKITCFLNYLMSKCEDLRVDPPHKAGAVLQGPRASHWTEKTARSGVLAIEFWQISELEVQ